MSDELVLPIGADTADFVQQIARATTALAEFAKAEDEARKQAKEEAKAAAEAAAARRAGTEAAKAAAKAAKEKADADKEAAAAAKKAADEEKKRGDGIDQLNQKLKDIGDGIGKYTFAFNQATDAIGKVVGAVRDGVENVVRLGGEFSRINNSARQTGIDFDAAARSTHGYVDRLQLATNAMRFHQASQTISQRQMEAIIARAQEYARTNGDLAGSIDALTDAVLEGEEDGLRRFGGSLASLGGESHTVQERLNALTVDVQHQGEAVVTAADRWERFKGSITEFGREASGGFMQGLTDSLNAADQSVRHVQEKAEEGTMTWNEFFEALGHGVAAEREAFGAAKDAVDSLVYAILALGGTAGAADDMATNWRQAAEQIERAGIALGVVQGRAPSSAPLPGAANPADGPELGGVLSRFGANLLNQGQQSVDLLRMRGSAGAAALAASRAQERKNDLAREAARQSSGGGSSPKEIRGGLVTDLWSDNRPSMLDQLGFTGESPDSLAVLTDAGQFDESGQTERDVGKSASQRAADEAAFGQSDDTRLRDRRRDRTTERERREQETRLDQRESFVERWERLNNREIVANDVYAEALQATFEATGQSLATHFEGLAAGRETAAEFFEGLAADTMSALGKEAFGKGAFYTAEALGFAVTGNLASAGTAGAAAGAYFVAGGLLTAGASALGGEGGGSAPSAGGGGGGGSPSRPRLASDRGDSGGQNTTTTIIHQYAPTFGGRQGSDAEAGRQVQRYTGAEDRRRVDRGRS